MGPPDDSNPSSVPAAPSSGSLPPPARKSERPPARTGGAASLVGTTLSGRYRLDSILGEGGMGAVYAAEHTHMRKRVAIKVLHPEMTKHAEVVARFEREAMAAGHIDHPNVATATDFGKLDDGSFFLVLELVEGVSLRDLLVGGPLAAERAVHIGRQIASAVGRAHALGVVHRDLKPENVMLIQRGSDPDFVKVLDFGIAKVPVLDLAAPPPPSSAKSDAPKALTQLGMIYGTPEYMSPEQALGQPVDGRADLYALGVLLYEMLAGKRPFDHENMATLLGMHVAAPFPPFDKALGVPPELEALIARLMAKNPADRPQEARDVEDAFNAIYPPRSILEGSRSSLPSSGARGPFSSDPSGQTPSPTAPTQLVQPPKRGVWKLGAALGAFCLAFGFALVYLFWKRPAPPDPLEAEKLIPMLVPEAAPATAEPPPSSPVETASKPSAESVNTALAQAEEALKRKDAPAAIAALQPFEATNPGRAEVHRLLERAYAQARDRAGMMREAAAWLAAAPKQAQSDPSLMADLKAAAMQPETSSEAMSLLATRMGSAGVDFLYDVAYGGKSPQGVENKAYDALKPDDVRDRASPPVVAAMRLRSAVQSYREAQVCEGWRSIMEYTRTNADRRSVPPLQILAYPKGCGFLQQQDCYPCLHRDNELNEVLAVVRKR